MQQIGMPPRDRLREDRFYGEPGAGWPAGKAGFASRNNNVRHFAVPPALRNSISGVSSGVNPAVRRAVYSASDAPFKITRCPRLTALQANCSASASLTAMRWR
jgi:hypothetical protein